MKEIKIMVKDNSACVLNQVNLVAGTVGQPCQFFFDKEWQNLNKKISYKVGTTVLGTYAINSDKVVIPANVLTTAGLPLEIGITGFSSDNSLIIPTSWCLIGKINEGAVIHGGSNKPSDDDDDDTTHIIYDGGVIA